MAENNPNNKRLWELVLVLKKFLPLDKPEFCLSFSIQKSTGDILISKGSQTPDPQRIIFSFNSKPNTGWAASIYLSKNDFWPVFINYSLPEESFVFLKNYLPYVFIRLKSNQIKRTLSIGHLAMSLDGKIATVKGNSQWIGNKTNQIHSHRMRALSDAILVGGNTFVKDNPQLNVRYVDGNDPIKIVMGDGEYDFKKSSKDADFILVNSNPERQNNGIGNLSIKRNQSGFNCTHLLNVLYKQNIHVIYIEGGGITLSGFIKSKALDILQLHYAPIIMGSGISCFKLPEIDQVDHAHSFSYHQFEAMGDESMFTGVLNYK